MGWYVTQLWLQLLIAMLVGLFAGWLLWRWGWKKHVLTQEHEVTRLRTGNAEKDKLVKAAHAENDEIRAAHGATRAELATAQARIASLEAELAAARAAHASASGELVTAHALLADERAARTAAEAQVIDLRDEDPDDLKVVEGIGPKMEQALNAAGIRTWRRLAATDEATLRRAIEQAGMNFAPSLVTWAEQADLLARGEMAAFKALTDRLVAGRAPEQG